VSARTLRLDGIDPRATISPLVRLRADPTSRLDHSGFWRAVSTPNGPGTLRLRWDRSGWVEAEAWGPGRVCLLDRVSGLLGVEDDLHGFAPSDPRVARLHHVHATLRLTRTGALWNELAMVVVEQRVSTPEAARSWARLVRRFGEPAPGPGGLLAPPDPEVVAGSPYWAFHPLGVERRRADTLRRAARGVDRLGPIVGSSPEDVAARLQSIDGVGPWTGATVVALTHGDPDAVPVGDAGIPGLVGWALAGERDADDARMLELLEPFRGHRYRVIRLLMAEGRWPPRRAPRAARMPIDDW
jgi:3-methyladenine DNA glycosylase/8-oxoguanine DNA glycosylase